MNYVGSEILIHIIFTYSRKRTQLLWACENGHLQIVNYLISKGADIEAKDKNGWTSLH